MCLKPSNFMDVSFPTEMLLEIIQHVPFDHDVISQLALIHPRLRYLLATYEASISKAFARRNLPHACTDFPGYEIKYSWLSQCIQKYDVVDEVMAALVSNQNCCAVEKHNMALVNAGLLLLYRVQSIDTIADKVAFIQSLSRHPLTSMFLAIHHSTLTARYHGDGIINQRRCIHFLDARRLSLRHDIEFCFAEGAMWLGPALISDTLLRASTAELTLMCLYHEHATNDWQIDDTGDFQPPVTQGPHASTEMKCKPLFSLLLERLAIVKSCPLGEVVRSIEDEVESPDHDLAWLALSGKARLLQGLDLVVQPAHRV